MTQKATCGKASVIRAYLSNTVSTFRLYKQYYVAIFEYLFLLRRGGVYVTAGLLPCFDAALRLLDILRTPASLNLRMV